MKNLIRKNFRDRKAVALISVLLMMALLSILAIAYLASMQIENRASESFANTQRAKMVAQGALAHSIELLRTSIPDPAGIDKSADTSVAVNWIVNPGQVTVIPETGNEVVIPLHTGAATEDPESTNDPDVHSVDLNEPLPGREEPAITYFQGANGEVDLSADLPTMRVKWVNILEDPSQPASDENPIIGRHAFWIDDESGKINFNTALGKPAPGEDASFDRQLDMAMMPSTFRRGSSDVAFNSNEAISFGLGRPSSVNMDVLFENSNATLDIDSLFSHSFLRGFSRYPESILDFVDGTTQEKLDWWHQNRYDLTFYSRSPEFNAFNRPRLMMTNTPLSLESGPYYQNPFVYPNSTGSNSSFSGSVEGSTLSGTLHLHGLMGTFGFTNGVDDGEERVLAGNIVNRGQADLLLRYLRREFPGYDDSFVDKYGEAECAQIALNMLNVARFATTGLNTHLNNFTRDQGWRTTSVLYAPHTNERRPVRANNSNRIVETPERHYWRYEPSTDGESGRFLSRYEDEPSTDKTVPMIPASPGPHVTEVRLIMRPHILTAAERSLYAAQWPWLFHENGTAAEKLLAQERLRTLKAQFEVEYYMHDIGPRARLRYFPVNVDYLKFMITGNRRLSNQFNITNDARYNQSTPYTFINEFGAPYVGNDKLYPLNSLIDHRHPTWSWWGRNWNFEPRQNRDQADGDPISQRNRVQIGSFQVQPNDSVVSKDASGSKRVVIRGSEWIHLGIFVDRNVDISRYAGHFTDQQPVNNDAAKIFADNDELNVKIFYRGGMTIQQSQGRTRQMWPLGEGLGEQEPSDLAAGAYDPNYSWDYEELNNVLTAEVDIDMSDLSDTVVSWQVSDPRLSGHKEAWVVETGGADAGTPGEKNINEPEDGSDLKSTFRYFQRAPEFEGSTPVAINGELVDRQTEFHRDSAISSKGFWSVIHTGIQNNVPYRTVRLTEPVSTRTYSASAPSAGSNLLNRLQNSFASDHGTVEGDPTGPPDYLLMDLLGSTYPMQRDQWRNNSTLPDEFSTISFMNSTAGTVNLNTRVFPEGPYFEAPQRRKPLKGVFKNLRSETAIDTLLDDIAAFQQSNRFKYPGELAKVSSYSAGASTQFEKEQLLRDMIGCLTTRSNTFGVWGVGQTVKKLRTNEEWGEFEDGDVVEGEKRFFALIERFIWPGIDGVPGNAHVNSAGVWDRIAEQEAPIPRDGSAANLLSSLPGSPPLRRGVNSTTGEFNIGVNLDRNGTYPIFDGPQPVEMDKFARATLGNVAYESSPLEEAYNPPQAVIKYKVVYFKYLDE